jgi:hypothetical protein
MTGTNISIPSGHIVAGTLLVVNSLATKGSFRSRAVQRALKGIP